LERDINDQDLAMLTGAPDGATVKITTTALSIQIDVRHPWYTACQRTIERDSPDQPAYLSLE